MYLFFVLELFCICLGLYPGDRYDRTISSKKEWQNKHPTRWIIFVKYFLSTLNVDFCDPGWLGGPATIHGQPVPCSAREQPIQEIIQGIYQTHSGDNQRYFSNQNLGLPGNVNSLSGDFSLTSAVFHWQIFFSARDQPLPKRMDCISGRASQNQKICLCVCVCVCVYVCVRACVWKHLYV